METRAHYVAVGTFVLVIVFAAFGAVLWLGRIEFGEELQTYYIFFKGSVAGLSRGSAVQYNGIPVGRVTDVRVDKDNVEQIQLTVEIDTNLVQIKKDARAYIETNILSGVSTIQIRGGTQEAAILMPKPGHRYPEIKAGRTELEAVKASLPELLGELKQVSQNLNKLFDERNRTAIAESLQNVKRMTAAFAEHTGDVGTILKSANASILELQSLLRNVDQSYTVKGGLKDQASQLIKHYDRVATNLTNVSRQLQLILGENRPGFRNFVQTTLPDAGDLISDAKQLAQNLNRLVEQLQRDPTRLLFGNRRRGYQPQ